MGSSRFTSGHNPDDLQDIIHQGLSEFCDEFRLNPLYLVKFMP